MESLHSFWQLGDELRGQSKVSEDHKWLMVASKLAEQTQAKGERVNNLDLSKGLPDYYTDEYFIDIPVILFSYSFIFKICANCFILVNVIF